MVVDDELGTPAENVDQSHGAVRTCQRVVRQLDRRHPPALGSDGIELTRGGLLPRTQIVERGLPRLPVDYGR